MHDRLFRCAGDIQFTDAVPTPGQVIEVHLKPFSETCNYLQHQRPLTPTHPCFFAQIRSLAKHSVVTLGVAGPDIHDDIHPGNWNGTVGYRSTGRCFSSHLDTANTEGHRFGVGDVFGVMVTYFGRDMSTVIFLKNGQPVATRYLFEEDHSHFLPTVTMENGPVDLGLMWPEAVIGVPKYSEKNMLHWIRPPLLDYDATNNVFHASEMPSSELVLQSPLPLSQTLPHFEVILREVSPRGDIPVIAIATCSPLIPCPTSVLLSDYFKWQPSPKNLQLQTGQRVGWGIHYNPHSRHSPDFLEQQQQLVLCFVSIDLTIVFAKLMLQPPGGWYPTIMLHSDASKVEIDIESTTRSVDSSGLDDLFERLLPEAEELIKEDFEHRMVTEEMLNKSPALEVEIQNVFTKVRLARDKKGIHVIQLQRPLHPDEAYFSVSVKKSGDCSVVCVGVAGLNFPLNRYPGRTMHTVGYHSRDGRMYYNDKYNGNMTGKRYGKGDTIGLEIEVFQKDMSVALFSKNGLPVGTRYLTLTDQTQFFPTIALCGNGSEMEVEVVWQNRIATPPLYSVTNIEHWCLPEGATADRATHTVYVERGHSGAEAIQAPYSLNRTYNHFEVELIEDFDDNKLPPAIALCTASPFDPTPKSNFKQDFIRFWATGEAQKAVKRGDSMGWGMLYPSDDTHHDEEQLVICYLTINRDVALTRVMFQPPGGFYPVVLVPPGVEKVRLNFGATVITKHPFTSEAMEDLIEEAKEMIAEEERNLAAGGDPEDWDSEQNKSKYLKPVPALNSTVKKLSSEQTVSSAVRKKPAKMVNVVELMMNKSLERVKAQGRTRLEDARELSEKGGPSQESGDQQLRLQLGLADQLTRWSTSSTSERSRTCCIL